MAGQRITKKVVDASRATNRDRFVWDAQLKGFALRVSPSGTKTFIVQYRAGGGRRGRTRRFTLGRADTLTADQARKAAKKLLGAVAQGGDPSGARKAKRREMTVSELVALYDNEGATELKERTRRYTLARLRHHVVPLLGHKKVSDVRVADVERLINDVSKGKTAKDEKVGPRRRVIVSGGPGAAAKVARDLSAVYSFARRREIVWFNPCESAKRLPDGKRTRFLTLEEVRRLGEAFNQLELTGTNPKAVTIARLWALTGCRRDEIAALNWSEVDFEHACLRLETSKTGKSVRPLAAPAVAILQSIPRSRGAKFVFPSETGETFYQGTKRVWPKAMRLARLSGVTPHTLRHTLGSAAVSSGETLAVTGAILGHANMRSTSRYAHMQTDPTKAAADRVVEPIATALSAMPSATLVPKMRAPGKGVA
jgi:integrase